MKARMVAGWEIGVNVTKTRVMNRSQKCVQNLSPRILERDVHQTNGIEADVENELRCQKSRKSEDGSNCKQVQEGKRFLL